MTRIVRWALAFLLITSCVPAGIEYPNLDEDGGTAGGGDGGGIDDGGQGGQDATLSGELAVLAGGVPVQGSYDFGLLTLGSTRTVSFTIDNGRVDAVTLSGNPLVTLTGDPAFSASQPTSLILAPGSSADFSISAAPTSITRSSGTVTIDTDVGPLSFDVNVEGRPPGIYVGAGGGGLRSMSTDGTSFSNEQSFSGSEDSNLFRGVAHGNGVFVAVGGGPNNGLLWFTENGIDWTDVSDTQGWLSGAAFGNDVFVAVGSNGRVLRGPNGRNWIDGDVDFQQHFRSIAFGMGRFVAVGEQGRRQWSTDGETWSAMQLGGDRLTKVVFADDRFIAVGLSGRRMVSMDGETWEHELSRGVGLFDVAYGEGTAVAVGGFGVTVTFDGGVTWEDFSAPPMAAIGYGNGRFVATGDFFGVTYTSEDGIFWDEHQDAGAAGFTGIAYGE